jgi:hypothetical protein
MRYLQGWRQRAQQETSVIDNDVTSGSAGPVTFTEAVSQLEAAGFDSMGFMIESGHIICVECGDTHADEAVGIGAMLRYATDGGEGHVFGLACPACKAKGLLFVAPDAAVGHIGEIVDSLTERARR